MNCRRMESMKKTENGNVKEVSKRKRPFLTFLVFLAVSTALWLLIKLSENYNTQTTFRVQIEAAPADKLVSSGDQTSKMSLDIDGFHTLRCRMIRDANRYVTISLDEVPYRLESGTVYSFSTQYVAEKVADRLGINASDITMNDDKVYFNMYDLASKEVPVVLQSDIKVQQQYGLYGIPTISPASVTIFGSPQVIDSIKEVKTMLLSQIDVNQSFSTAVPLDLLDGQIQSDTKEVQVEVQVEKFTEKDVEVPIKVEDSLTLRFFPEMMSVKCLVAMRDYASITSESFSIAIDKNQLKAMKPLLDVRLASWPNTVQILSTSPDKVEYLIVQ